MPTSGEAYHALKDPFGLLHFRLDAYTVVESDAEVRSTTDENGERVRVRCGHRQKHGGPFHGVRATSQETSDRTRDVREGLDRVERHWIEDAGFIIVTCLCALVTVLSASFYSAYTCKDVATWKDCHERIEVVRVSAIQPVHEQVRRPPFGRGKNLQRGLWSTIASDFTTND